MSYLLTFLQANPTAAFCNNNNNNLEQLCVAAITAVNAVQTCSDAAENLADGSITRDQATSTLCSGQCGTLGQAARAACSRADSDVSLFPHCMM